MSATEYIASFFLFIIGFAVSEIIQGSARLLRDRRLIRFYLPYLLVIPFVFEILIFWFLWIFTVINEGHTGPWSVLEILMLSTQVLPWAFISYLIFPTAVEKGFSLKDFYFENGKFVIGIVIFLNAYVIVDMLRVGQLQGMIELGISLSLNLLVLLNFRKLHLVWLISNILLVNYFIFFAKPILIR